MFRLQRILNSTLKPIAKPFATLRIPKPTLMLNSSNIYKLNHKKKKRVGRGLLSTAGRGRKGFKHRHGKQRVYRGYEGGQSTFVKKMPKLGPQTKSKKPLRPLYLDKLQQWIKLNRLGTKISIQDICTSGVAGKVKHGVVLIAKGGEFFTEKIEIEVTKATLNSIKIIESLGGSVKCVYHDKQRLHQLLNPQLYTKVPEMYLPPTLKMVGQYADENKRGYLSDIVKGVDRNEMLEAILSKVNIQLKQRK